MCQTSLGECFRRAGRWQQSPEEGLVVMKIRSEEREYTEDTLQTPPRARSDALMTLKQQFLKRGAHCLSQECAFSLRWLQERP